MIKQKLQQDQITAMKAHEQVRLDTIRYIISQINNKEINTQKELSDAEIITVIQKVKKELNESIDSFVKGSRIDLAEEYKKQLVVVMAYLPPELTLKEIKNKIIELKRQNKDAIAKNPKALIGIVMRTLRGTADPALIQKILQESSV
ncbi:hypothetical protein COY90_04690 [Candidatus Roizmanbacteria bacterium CG_4_10_14_0_8_um_filter_39_9]|uniref:Glutamyl-tRNA amidotransferase n=1 Tax=Candidatus Roizmanbacteria bacterium CG_4_10_14_0_8_um_filter_39_9 TaxID=1974829 RepID=A0A2M7QCT1_9BACT|nr:MAG: hypothetical protein COY90_04690 [Candidatus Roizmanbacteria bacterium CG_4_10_14_0_8_um_filter_39_9]